MGLFKKKVIFRLKNHEDIRIGYLEKNKKYSLGYCISYEKEEGGKFVTCITSLVWVDFFYKF